MKRGKGLFIMFVLIGLLGFVIASLVLNGTTTYDSTDENVTQETGFAHLNISDADLVLYMPFDYNHSSGVVHDYSNNSNDGVMQGFTNNYTVDGKYGGAYSFDGTNDYISIDDTFSAPFGTGSTISFWFKIDNSTTDWQNLLGSISDSYNYIAWRISGVIQIESGANGGATQTSSATFSANEWNHIVVQCENYICSIFKNGVNGSGSLVELANTDFLIDRIGRSASNIFNGSMDEIMIFNRTLTASEILAIYNNQSSRFFPTGEMFFTGNNLGTNNTVNISLENCGTLNGSYLQAKINSGSYQNFSSCNITNYPASGDLTSANLTLKLIAGDNYFYSSLIIGNITLTSLDNQSSTVIISSPTNGSTSTSSLVNFSVITNENSTCNYSLDSGTTNNSFTANATGTGHTGANTSMTNGNYIMNVYCADLQGNTNNTQNVSFTVAVPAATTTTEEEQGNPNGFTGVFTPSENILESGYSVNLGVNQKVEIPIGSGKKTVAVKEISNSENKIVVTVNDVDYEINSSGNVKIDLDGDGFYDVEISNNGITGSYVNLNFVLINEEIPNEEQEAAEENIREIIEQDVKQSWYVYVGVLVVVVLIVILVLLKDKKVWKKK